MTRQYLAKGSGKLDLIIAKHFQEVYNKNTLDAKPSPTAPRDTGCTSDII